MSDKRKAVYKESENPKEAGMPINQTASTMTQFESGATRSNDADKIDPEGFLSPLVIRRYSEYLHKHRIQADGKVRDSDNWQRGMPMARYVKSAWRHFLNWWSQWRGWPPTADEDIEAAACAVLFNVSGWLHERLKSKLPESCLCGTERHFVCPVHAAADAGRK